MPTPSEAGQTSSQVSRSIQTRNRVRMVRQRRGVQQDDVDTLYDASSQSNATAPRRVAAWVQTLAQSAFPAGATRYGDVTELRGASLSPRMSLMSDLRIDLNTRSGGVNIRWNGGSLLVTGSVHIRSSHNVWTSDAVRTPDGGWTPVAELSPRFEWPPHYEWPLQPGWPPHTAGTSQFGGPYNVGGMPNHQLAGTSSMNPGWFPQIQLEVTHHFRRSIREIHPFVRRANAKNRRMSAFCSTPSTCISELLKQTWCSLTTSLPVTKSWCFGTLCSCILVIHISGAWSYRRRTWKRC